MKGEKERDSKKIVSMALTAILVISAFAASVPSVSAANEDVTVTIDDCNAPTGGSVTKPIMINNVTDVGTATISLIYDASVVHVDSISGSPFDFCDSTIDNTIGITTIGVMQLVSPGLTGDVKVGDVKLTAVGSPSETSALGLVVIEMKDATPPLDDIPRTVINGTFTIWEITPPIVKDPRAEPLIIPEDTDNEPLWRELTELMVNATDESGVANVTIDLSPIGKGIVNMSCIGESIFNYSTNASVGTAGWNETAGAYEPYCLQVNATDIYGNSNTSVCINLTVVKNGDVNLDGSVALSDAMYLAKHVLGKAGYETIQEGASDVVGDGDVALSDAMYLAKYVLGKPGYEILH